MLFFYSKGLSLLTILYQNIRKAYQENDLETNKIFSKSLKLEILKIFIFQNAVPTILTFSTILKLQKSKTKLSIKKNFTFGNTQCVFQHRISVIEKPSEVTMLNCLK